jgi:hypothetical protein
MATLFQKFASAKIHNFHRAYILKEKIGLEFCKNFAMPTIVGFFL